VELRYTYRGRLISVRLIPTPEGARELVEHPGAVAILVRDPEARVLLVRQSRVGAGGYMWEIPAGTREPGEPPLATAQRELLEETGLEALRWTQLGTIFPTPGYSNERITLFLAEEVAGEAAGRSEIDEARFFTVQEIVSMAREDRGDAKTLAALALAGG